MASLKPVYTLLGALALVACRDKPAEAPAAESQALSQPAPPPPAAPPAPPPPAAPPADAPSEHPAGYPRAGWSKVSEDDSLPLCVFPNLHERAQAKQKSEAKPAKLPANSSIAFGAFGPFPCIHESCDQLPTLQCYVDQPDKTTLVVHTHYSGYHKDGATCSENCREITAGCETTVLAPGTYTVKHGAKTYKLKLPSTPKSACFE